MNLKGCVVGALLMLPLLSVQAAEGWELAKEEDGVKVYLQTVPGSKYKAYRGVALMDTDVATLKKLQEDVGGACAWIHECKEQKLLKQEGSTAVTYTRFNTPWPVTPRDSVVQVTESELKNGGLRRDLKGLPQYLPEEDGYVRVSEVEGFWEMNPQPGGEVEVVYQVHTEPGGSVPSWLANKFVVEAPLNTLRNLRERAEKR